MSDTHDPITMYLLDRVKKLERENERLSAIALFKPTPLADLIRDNQRPHERDFTPLKDWWPQS